jgi:hypothetical protein
MAVPGGGGSAWAVTAAPFGVCLHAIKPQDPSNLSRRLLLGNLTVFTFPLEVGAAWGGRATGEPGHGGGSRGGG